MTRNQFSPREPAARSRLAQMLHGDDLNPWQRGVDGPALRQGRMPLRQGRQARLALFVGRGREQAAHALHPAGMGGGGAPARGNLPRGRTRDLEGGPDTGLVLDTLCVQAAEGFVVALDRLVLCPDGHPVPLLSVREGTPEHLAKSIADTAGRMPALRTGWRMSIGPPLAR